MTLGAAGGTGYPENATVDLAVIGGGGSGGVVAVTTNASGVVTGLAANPIVNGGANYQTTPGATTNMSLITGGTVTLTADKGIGVDPTSGIGTTATEINMSVTTLSATTTTGDIFISQASAFTLNATSLGYSNSSAMTGSDINASTTTGDLTVGVVSALGTVTLSAGGALSAPNGSAVSLTANTLNLTAANGIGTSSAVVKTSANTLLSAEGGTGGVFLSNNQSLSVTSASAGGDVSITAVSDLGVGSVSAGTAGDVSLTAGGAITGAGGAGAVINITTNSSGAITGATLGAGGAGYPANATVDLLITSVGGFGGIVAVTTNAEGVVTAMAADPIVNGGANYQTTPGATTLAASVTALNATLSGSEIGSPGDPLGTQVSSSITAKATSGPLYISDLSTGGTLMFTASAAGAGGDIDFTSAESIELVPITTSSLPQGAVTDPGNTVTLIAAGSITNGDPAPDSGLVNITAATLNIVAPGGIGTSGDHLQVVVGEVNTEDGGSPGAYMDNAGPEEVTQNALTAPGTGTLTFSGSSITIDDMLGNTVKVAAGRSLIFQTQTGPIVFLNPADTIETSNGGSITVNAGMTAGSGGVAVLGNLSTIGIMNNYTGSPGSIMVTADGSITIGTLNAGSAEVTVQSANGIIINGNGPSPQPNIIAGSTTLSGNAPTPRLLQLNEENDIAAAAAASAEESADQTTANAFAGIVPIAIAGVVGDAIGTGAQAVSFGIDVAQLVALTGPPDFSVSPSLLALISSVQSGLSLLGGGIPNAQTLKSLQPILSNLAQKARSIPPTPDTPALPPLPGTVLGTEEEVDAGAIIVYDTSDDASIIANPIGGAAQIIPLTGDGGAAEVEEDVDDIEEGADQAATDANSATTDTEAQVAQAWANAVSAFGELVGDIINLGSAAETLVSDIGSDNLTASAASSALLQSNTAAVVSEQAIMATNQGNVIGSPTAPIVLQVTGAVNVTAGPTDSYLQVAGNTAVDQINATGSVTLISTGAITHGSGSGTDITATGLTLSAANGIGTMAKPLVTQVPALSATNTSSGDIYIDNTTATPALDITGISNSGGGNINISNTGNGPTDDGINVTGPIEPRLGAPPAASTSPPAAP